MDLQVQIKKELLPEEEIGEGDVLAFSIAKDLSLIHI